MASAPAYVPGDVYPYLAGMTALRALFIPGWAQEGGRPEMLKRFKDPAMRARIAGEAEELMAGRVGGPANIHIVGRQTDLAAYMRQAGVGAGEAIVRLVEELDPRMIGHFGAEGDLKSYLRHPTMAVSCDCGARVEDPQHPRGTGTFPKVLGRYVREQGILTWEDAVRKMTGLPANIIGLTDRGFLAPGMAADVAIFDPKTVIDRSTYEKPALLPEGMKYVLVNGGLAVKDGRPTALRAGLALRRGGNMPSRPMSASLHRRLAASATLPGSDGIAAGPVKLSFNLSQAPGAAARGTLRIIGPDGKSLVRAVSYGMVQASGSWASFTAQATSRNGSSQPVSITVDEADPLRKGAASITFQMGDLPPRTGLARRGSLAVTQSKSGL